MAQLTDEALDTIVRVLRRDNPFVMVERATVQDKRLSWEARGLLVYLLSLPTDWDIRVSHLQTEGDVGRDALRRMLRELQRYGYASGVGRDCQERGARGRFRQTEIRVYESPKLNPYHAGALSPSPENPSTVGQPSPDSPSPENPSPGKASTYKVDTSQTKQRTKNIPTPRAHECVRLPAARAARAGGRGSHLSRFDFQTQCIPWAEAVKATDPSIRSARALARARWMDGTADDEIATWLEARTPEAVTRSLHAPACAQMSFKAALIRIRSILDVDPELNIPGCVAQLDVSEDTRAQLLAHDFSKRRKVTSA